MVFTKSFKFMKKIAIISLLIAIIPFISLIFYTKTQDLIILATSFLGIVSAIAMFLIIMLILKKVRIAQAHYLLEDADPDRSLLLVLRKGESYFSWGRPVPPDQIEDIKTGAVYEDLSDFTTFLAGHNLKLVLPDVDHTLSPAIVQYTTRLKKEFKFKDLDEVIKFQEFLKNHPEIEKLMKEREEIRTKIEELNEKLIKVENDIYKKLEVIGIAEESSEEVSN